MRSAVVNKITEFARKNKNIFLVTGDAGFGVLDEYKNNFPQRFLNLGVAEQNMIGFSAGLALSGFKVFIYNIIPFLLFRSYEQVRNDICYQRLPIVLVGIGSGVTYAPQGVTHYSIEDVAIARTLPNLVIFSPCDRVEARACAEYSLTSKNPVYIRVAKSGEPVIHKKLIKNITAPITITRGSRVAVLFYGSVGIEVIKAIDGFSQKPIVISIPMLGPLNFNALLQKLKNVHTIITVEEHFAEGGLGSIIAEWIVRKRLPFRLRKLGIRNEFIHLIKNNSGLRCEYGICADNIGREIKEAF